MYLKNKKNKRQFVPFNYFLACNILQFISWFTLCKRAHICPLRQCE